MVPRPFLHIRARPIAATAASGKGPGRPASVALLVDGSGSMKATAAADAAMHISNAVLLSLNPARDDAALFSFDTRLLTIRPFTRDIAEIGRALGEVKLAFGARAHAQARSHRPHSRLVSGSVGGLTAPPAPAAPFFRRPTCRPRDPWEHPCRTTP